MNEWMRRQAEGMRGMTEKELNEHLGRGMAQSPPQTPEERFNELRKLFNVYEPSETTVQASDKGDD